ncbi:serine protease [Luteimonas lutimaris]|uniref:S1 family peptidase n=1 Tax=Luteimonas lutimaris TaxID=698645 RepID=UPI0031D6801C
MSPSTYISLSTVRLLCGSGGDFTSVGTGFFYITDFGAPEGVAQIPLVITNKHVVKGFVDAKLFLTTCNPGEQPDETGATQNDQHREALISGIDQRLMLHPDPNVDLCAFPIQDICDAVVSDGRELRLAYLNDSYLVPGDERPHIRVIESVAMIGYPNGLWDQSNNRPLVRRGSTASHPFVRWNGRREFVIDAACFPGSSGSPVFLFEDVMFRQRGGAYTPGSKAHLLGVLASGPWIDREGRIVRRDVPAATTLVPIVPAMMNLGNVVHADAIRDLLPIIGSAVQAGLSFPRAALL